VENLKRFLKPRNVIGLVALVTVVSVGVVEIWARYGAVAAVRKLEAAQAELERNRSAPPLTEDQVRAIVGRLPARIEALESTPEKQMYVWKGVFRQYTVNAYFAGAAPKILTGFDAE
jgi:hypothetical protein